MRSHLATAKYVPEKETCLFADVMDDFSMSEDFGTLEQFCTKCYDQSLRNIIRDCRVEWVSHVKHSLYKGTRDMYAYISREEKEFLNITIAKASGFNNDLDAYLSSQREVWAGYWI